MATWWKPPGGSGYEELVFNNYIIWIYIYIIYIWDFHSNVSLLGGIFVVLFQLMGVDPLVNVYLTLENQ
jgi:hypothetical protein